MGGTFHTYTCHICLHGMFGLLQDVRLPSSSGSTQVNDTGHSAIPVSLCFHSDSYSIQLFLFHSAWVLIPVSFRFGSYSGSVSTCFWFSLPLFFQLDSSTGFPFFVPPFGSFSGSALVRFLFGFHLGSVLFLVCSYFDSIPVRFRFSFRFFFLLIPPFWFPIPIPFRFLFRFGSCIRVLVPDPFPVQFYFVSIPVYFCLVPILISVFVPV